MNVCDWYFRAIKRVLLFLFRGTVYLVIWNTTWLNRLSIYDSHLYFVCTVYVCTLLYDSRRVSFFIGIFYSWNTYELNNSNCVE